MINDAVADTASAGGDASGVTLLRVLASYERVLKKHNIAAIEDTVTTTQRPNTTSDHTSTHTRAG